MFLKYCICYVLNLLCKWLFLEISMNIFKFNKERCMFYIYIIFNKKICLKLIINNIFGNYIFV